MGSSTVGQLLLRSILPADVYDGRPLDKGALKEVMSQVAERYPDQYEDIAYKLVRLGLKTGESVGGASFGDEDLRSSKVGRERNQRVRQSMKSILDQYDGPERMRRIRELLDSERQSQISDVMAEVESSGNAFGLQLKGAGRGSPKSVTSLLGGDVAVEDSRGQIVPIPVTRGYTQGLSPMQYLSASYGARQGIVGTKLGVGTGGFLSKLLQQSAHRAMVTGIDDDRDYGRSRGLIAEVDDKSNVGALLAKDYGDYKRNQVITPKVMAGLKKQGLDEILVRSPISGANPEGGIYARDAGIRETGRLANVGDHIGQGAAQSIGEIATQAALGQKHQATVKKKDESPGAKGFDLIERLANLSVNARDFASHATADGRVRDIKEAPQGGLYVHIGDGEPTYVAPGFKPSVKVGDYVEAGDSVSNGPVNPAMIVQHKGIGEGRRVFVETLRKAMPQVDRRQIELLATGLIDRVEMNEEVGDFLPGDLVPYSRLAAVYRPRDDSAENRPKLLEGQYLEEPALHYSVGTRITPSVWKAMEKHGVAKVWANRRPPPFSPRPVRGLDLLASDPDWMVRFGGSGVNKSFMEAVSRGRESDERSTSIIPTRAKGIHLGQTMLQGGGGLED